VSDTQLDIANQCLKPRGTLVTLAISQLAILDGILRVMSLSWRWKRQPTTMSYPESIVCRNIGMSSGSFCRSPSMVTMMLPVA